MNLMFLKRIFLFYTRIKNLCKFKLHNIKFGCNLCVHGTVNLHLENNSSVIIGNNFYYSSGNFINPLARNLKGCICCNQSANLIIGNNVSMSSAVIWAHKYIKIGNNVMCGANVIIMDSNAHSLNHLDRRNIKFDLLNKKDSPIIIEDDVFIGVNSIIMKGVTIGARSVIGAGSVVTKSIPADSIACGNPARVVKSLK